MADVRDLSEEAEDEILKSTGKIDFTQDSEYIRLFGERDLKKEKVCLYESKSSQETLEGEGADTCSVETNRQNTGADRS